MNIFVISIVAIFLVFSILFCILFKLFLSYKVFVEDLKLKASLNFEDNLELATSEQLLKELRKRKDPPFILLCPIKEKDYNGISIESHSMNSTTCLSIIHLAKEVAIQNMKRKGESFPNLPSLDDYFN